MQIGMTLPTMAPDVADHRLFDWIDRIESGPFSTIAVGERIAFPNPEAWVVLAAAVARTKRVRVASTLAIAPLRSTAWLAKQVATLDVLSEGRFVLGLGVGGREEDYRAVGVSYARRHERLDAQVAEMRRLWAGEALDAETGAIGPTPTRAGGPPLWTGASSERPLRRAAQWAEGVAGFSFGPDPAEVRHGFDAADRAWEEAGRAGRPRHVTSFWYALGPGAEERLAAYARRYLAVFGEAAATALSALCLAAGEERLRDLLAQLRDAGADEVLLVPTTADPAELARTEEILARD
ncbi:MAG: LLM class flavin-dependent oxidoreductase [Myxococcales bacterium]|nr:LLM class flavin-dependent oxidoreductase [Myxococcales bacterium]